MLLLLSAVLCGGCDSHEEAAGAPPETGWSGSIDTMTSGAIVVENPEDGIWPASPRLVERLRIGSRDGEGPTAFGRIGAIAVDLDGRVYVADPHAAAIRIFDEEGRYLRSLGRSGQGPGEIGDPVGLAWQNDSTLWVVDYGNARYSIYDTSGAHVQDLSRASLGSLWPWPGRFAESRLIEPRVMTGAYRLVAVDPSATAAPVDTFPFAITGVPPEHWEPAFWVRRGGSVRRVPVPFAGGYKWTLDEQGRVWGGDSREYKLIRRTLSGDTLLVIIGGRPAVPVTAAERETALDVLGEVDERVDLSRIPEHKPFLRFIIATESGGVWLVREGPGEDWLLDVFDEGGRYMGTAPMPVRPDLQTLPVSQGSSLWLVALDSLDVPSVVRLELEAPRG